LSDISALASGACQRVLRTGLDDVLIARAATEVRRQNLENLLVRQFGIGLQRVYRKHQEAGRAEAALKRMMSDECILHRVQFVAVREAFDRSDTLALRLDGKHEAGSYRVICRGSPCSAADAVLATDMRPGAVPHSSRMTSASVLRGSTRTEWSCPLM
jgi:hypothetical protein